MRLQLAIAHELVVSPSLVALRKLLALRDLVIILSPFICQTSSTDRACAQIVALFFIRVCITLILRLIAKLILYQYLSTRSVVSHVATMFAPTLFSRRCRPKWRTHTILVLAPRRTLLQPCRQTLWLGGNTYAAQACVRKNITFLAYHRSWLCLR